MTGQGLPHSRCRYFGTAQTFGSDERGATAVEFGLIGIPFLGILFAIFQVSFVIFNQQVLETVTANASRQLLIGQLQLNGMTTSQQQTAFQNMICPLSGPRPSTALPVNFNCANVIIDVRASSTFSNVDTTNALYANPGSAQFSPAPAGQINIVRVIYPLPTMLPILTGGGANSTSVNRSGQVSVNSVWSYVIMGIAVFKTEPYS